MNNIYTSAAPVPRIFGKLRNNLVKVLIPTYFPFIGVR